MFDGRENAGYGKYFRHNNGKAHKGSTINYSGINITRERRQYEEEDSEEKLEIERKKRVK